MNPLSPFSLWEYLINLSELLLFYYYTHHIFDNPISSRKRYSILFLAAEWILLCILNRIDTIPTVFTVGISYFFDIFFVTLFFQSSVLHKFLFGSFFSVFCTLADFTAVSLLQLFSEMPLEEVMIGGAIRFPMTAAYILILSGIVFFFLHFLKRKSLSLSLWEKVSFPFLTATGVLASHYLLAITIAIQSENSKLGDSLAFVDLLFIILFLAFLINLYHLADSRAQIYLLAEKGKIQALENEQYQNIIKISNTFRGLKHDFEKQLRTIAQLNSEGKSAELSEYLSLFQAEIQHSLPVPTTGIAAVDCLLSDRIHIAKQNGISVQYSCFWPKELFLDPVRLVSVLGNLFDNAIEACQALKTAQKLSENDIPVIHFSVKPYQGMLAICIDNPSSGQYRFRKDHTLLSTKTASSSDPSHGIGLGRVQQIVDQEHGILHIIPEAEKFTVQILLPFPESKT